MDVLELAKHILITLDGQEHELTKDQATELHDKLTVALKFDAMHDDCCPYHGPCCTHIPE